MTGIGAINHCLDYTPSYWFSQNYLFLWQEIVEGEQLFIFSFLFFHHFSFSLWCDYCYKCMYIYEGVIVVGEKKKLFQFLTNFNRQKFRVNEQTLFFCSLVRLNWFSLHNNIINKRSYIFFFHSRAVTTAKSKWTMQISKSEGKKLYSADLQMTVHNLMNFHYLMSSTHHNTNHSEILKSIHLHKCASHSLSSSRHDGGGI